jgi:hypothetical protein
MCVYKTINYVTKEQYIDRRLVIVVAILWQSGFFFYQKADSSIFFILSKFLLEHVGVSSW